MDTFDLVVIGSGPAGEKGAAQAAYFGEKVALIEKEMVLGGAAANTGTLPSKTLRETALYLSGYRQRGLFGVELNLKRGATVRDLMFRERIVAESERVRIARNLDRHHVTLFRGAASFEDAHTVLIKTKGSEARITGRIFLIATGSSPFRPSVYPFHDARVYDSDTILNLLEIPRSMAVVGGGVIGCEYACMFAALGIEVKLIEGRDTLLPFLDGEFSALLRERMESLGVEMLLPDAVDSVQSGPEQLAMILKSGRQLQVETILVASGRSGNTQDLHLEPLGIKVGSRGHIEVDQITYQTAVPHIYAAGDVIGGACLASTSMEQARLAMIHAFDLKYKKGLAPILPYGIYTIPELSMAGETEESLQKAKVGYLAGRATYGHNARGQIIGDGGGMLKLLFSSDDAMRLLGVHVIGEQASEIVHIGLTALLTGSGADLFIQTCYNYPTLSETYKYAAYDAMGKRRATAKA